jgi:hypothetical protein
MGAYSQEWVHEPIYGYMHPCSNSVYITLGVTSRPASLSTTNPWEHKLTNRLVNAIATLTLLSVCSLSAFAQLTDEKRIELVTRSVIDICKSPSAPGNTFDIAISGSGGAIAGLRNLPRAGGEVKAEFSKSEWEGVQRVLKEQQLAENNSYRGCVTRLTPLFLEKFLAPPPSPRTQTGSEERSTARPLSRSERIGFGPPTCKTTGSSVTCEVEVFGARTDDFSVYAFAKQRGGLRNTRLDKFGTSKLEDDVGGLYPANSVFLGNRVSDSTGQAKFSVVAGSNPLLGFRFDGVPQSVKAVKKLTLAIAVELSSGPEANEIVARDVPIEGR